jgi:hypothetical protein
MSQLYKRFTGALFVLAFVVIAFSNVDHVSIRAREAAAKFSGASVESKFRKALTFNVKVESVASRIVGARVIVTSIGDSASQIHRAVAFEPANTVTIKAIWNTESDVMPPWKLMSYQWEIVDEAGNITLSESIDFDYADDTHPWKSLTDGKVSVYWYSLSDSFGKTFFKTAQKAFEQISAATEFTPNKEIRIVVYPTQKSFLTFFPTTAKKLQEWYGGQTYGTMTVQWSAGVYTLNEVIPHELAHAFLSFRLQGRLFNVPAWFDEGQAVNNQFSDVKEALSRTRARVNRVFRFAEMETNTNWGNNLQAVRNWYDQAASMVNFLYTKYEPTVLGKILAGFDGGKKFNEALQNATGLTQAEFEKDWRKWIGAPPLTEADYAPTATLELPAFPTARGRSATPTSTP